MFLCKLKNLKNSARILAWNTVRRCSGEAGAKFNRFTYRTHNCGQLRRRDVGKDVVLCGWLQFFRSRKFLLLRDAYGLIQVLIPDNPGPKLSQTVDKLTFESVLRIDGRVAGRPEKDVNPKMATGSVEVVVKDMEILNSSRPNLPFEIKNFLMVKDDTLRLKYRYLYLRQSKMQYALRLRSEMVGKMRRYLLEEVGFVEVETPTLFRRTPGGAAEYLVPTSLPGQFYSLPQSPQQFKQLLMIGGIDRYFQMARCYRDEGVKPDRQPEFTQVDLEMSFVDKEGVMRLVENLLAFSWPENLPKLLTPFPRITYHHAIGNYGTDKPDLRFGMRLIDLTKFMDDMGVELPGNSVADWSVQCIICPGTTKGHVTKTMVEKWRELVKSHPFAQKFSVLKFRADEESGDSMFSGNLAKYFDKKSQMGLLEELNFNPEDLLVLSWGRREGVQKTLGFLRLKLADCLDSAEGEVSLRNPNRFEFVWVEDFPLFLKDDQGNLESAHHPFTAPIPEHQEKLIYSNPELVIGLHYDLVLNGVELGGGSIRIHDSKLQKFVLERILGEDVEEMRHLLDALEMGAPPHGGIALGLDRLMMVLCKVDSIREVIAFPKNSEGRDPMSNAPAEVEKEDLDRYHIRIKDS